MKVAFFIGHHKTGSTSLQTFLATHYLTLLQSGILYPAVESKGIASNLATMLHGTAQVEPNNINVREPHNALAFALISEATATQIPPWHKNLPSGFQMLQTIEEQMTVLNPRHTIICLEVMSRIVESGWESIKPRLQTRFEKHECSVVLNLRRIDDYLAAWHLQQLKFGLVIEPLRNGAQHRYYQTSHFRYDQIVLRWSQTLPNAQFKVRNYTDVIAAGGSVVDFFAQSQIDFAPPKNTATRNISVPYALAEVMRHANAAIPNHRADMWNYLLSAAQRIELIPNAEVELFGPKNRAALLKAFRPIHKDLSNMVGLAKFFPDVEDIGQCRPIAEEVAASAALHALRRDATDHAPSAEVRDFLMGLRLERSHP